MKRTIARTTLLIVTFAMFCMSMASAAHAQYNHCSTAALAGKWGFTLTGTLLLPSGPVPAAAVGIATADMDGNISVIEARSVGGGFADETGIGTWTVNPDCTGTLNINFYESGQLVRTSVTSIVFDDNRQFRMVQQSLTLPDGTVLPVVILIDGKRQ